MARLRDEAILGMSLDARESRDYPSPRSLAGWRNRRTQWSQSVSSANVACFSGYVERVATTLTQ